MLQLDILYKFNTPKFGSMQALSKLFHQAEQQTTGQLVWMGLLDTHVYTHIRIMKPNIC